jgi:protein ImuB
MYACLHHPGGCCEQLLGLAAEFSPLIEQTEADTLMFSIDPLRKLLGSPHQIASEICRAGYERKLEANLAVASNPDTAILLARHFAGVTLVTPGQERFKLASLPVAALFAHDVPVDPKLLGVLHRWGVKTCEELAALPERGVSERLGPAGVYLRNLAWGTIDRPLRVAAPATSYQEGMQLEHPLELLEPLLFLLGSALGELCRRLRSQSQAARVLKAEFTLDEQKEYRCELEFPVPLDESPTLLKLLQLHLERHPPEAAVVAFTLRVEPAAPRRVQGGFFLPPAPPPDKLQITLARIAGMVGKENVGTPVLLNTHRPDGFAMAAFEMGALHMPSPEALQRSETEHQGKGQESLRLVMRLFRPALPARVSVAGAAPKKVLASGVKGAVIRSAGPWKTSGEWWASTAWNREEWDVALDDGVLYRIYREMPKCEWYVHGIYD